MALQMQNAKVFWRDEDDESGRRTYGLTSDGTKVFITSFPTERTNMQREIPNPVHDVAWADLVKGAEVDLVKMGYYTRKVKGTTYHNFTLIDYKK